MYGVCFCVTKKQRALTTTMRTGVQACGRELYSRLLPPPPLFFHHHLPKPSTHPTLSSARPTPACRSESSALSQSRGGTQPPIRITGVFMHACFQEMEMKWRIVWEDLTYFAPGWGDQDHLYNTLLYTSPLIFSLTISRYFSSV